EEDTVTPEEHLAGVFAAARNESGAFIDEAEQARARAVAEAALGVPVRVLLDDPEELLGRARIVRNTVERDPNMPTLAEVRELLDAPSEKATGDAAGTPAEPAPASPVEADAHN